jgi:hypothetical protein
MDTVNAKQHLAYGNMTHDGGKKCGERECTPPTQHRATVLQMLVQLERRTILWPHHQVGLQWTKSPPVDAQLCQQSP